MEDTRNAKIDVNCRINDLLLSDLVNKRYYKFIQNRILSLKIKYKILLDRINKKVKQSNY